MKMEQVIYNFWSIISQVSIGLIAALGAGYFGWKQTQINERLKNLQDYVSISVIAITNSALGSKTYEAQFTNVGKINIYLKKYEIGITTINFSKTRLLPASGNPSYTIPIVNYLVNQEMNITLYLEDEFGKKYLYTGAIIIDGIAQQTQQPVQPNIPGSTPQYTQQTILIPGIARAWSYKTEKKDWLI